MEGKIMVFYSESPEETEKIAYDLAKKVNIPITFCLKGDLGSGKTAFTRGLSKGFGYDARVSSPTFTIMNVYEGDVPIYHFDLYRLSDIDELYDLGFEPEKKSVTVAEWYEGYEEFFEGDNILYVNIERIGFEDKRKIEISESVK